MMIERANRRNTMKQEILLEQTALPAVLWLPEGECDLVLQIAHGMTEHMGRYQALARVLTEAGIAVAGFDLPGHGCHAPASRCASLGEQGWQQALEQLEKLHQTLEKRLPGRKQVLLGFSLGSFLVRDAVGAGRCRPDGVILMGSGDQPSFVLRLLKAVVRGQIRKFGFDAASPLVDKLSFGAYNQKFRPNRTQADWLCADGQQVDAYLGDPKCCPSISAGLFWQLLDAMQRTGKDRYSLWNREAPVLLLSGGDDPVGNAGKGMKAVQQKMKRGGLTDVTLELIGGARHDLLHEAAGGRAEQGVRTLLAFLTRLRNG